MNLDKNWSKSELMWGNTKKFFGNVTQITHEKMLTTGIEPVTLKGQILNLLCLPISPSKL